MITMSTLCSDMYVNMYLWFLRHSTKDVSVMKSRYLDYLFKMDLQMTRHLKQLSF